MDNKSFGGRPETANLVVHGTTAIFFFFFLNLETATGTENNFGPYWALNFPGKNIPTSTVKYIAYQLIQSRVTTITEHVCTMINPMS